MTTNSYQSHLPFKISWRPLIAWGLVILTLWVMRHFFFIIFLTFIVSYSMRGLVVFLRNQFFPGAKSRFLELGLAVLCFLGLLTGLYGVGAYLVPEFISQGEALVKRLGSPGKGPQQTFDELLRDSIGRWLFQQKYGQRTTPLYQSAYQEYISESRQVEELKSAVTRFEEAFTKHLLVKEGSGPDYPQMPLPEGLRTFESWVEQQKAPEILRMNEKKHREEWQQFYRREAARLPGLTPLNRLTESQRDAALLQYVAANLLQQTDEIESLREEWSLTKAKTYVSILREQHPEKVYVAEQQFFRENGPAFELLPEQYEGFLALRNTLRDTSPASPEALGEFLPPASERSSESSYLDFEKSERLRLVTEWKKGELATKLQAFLERSVVSTVAYLGTFLGEAIPRILILPFQLGLVLLLSFLITIDVPRLRAGVKKLKQSRVSELYEEVAPGIVSFGRLIGRAFQAQAVIAVVNSVLTLLAIKILGIQNEIFLCVVVFLFSFVPVLGVVFSSIPIAVMALIQDDGGILVAVWAIVAILLIHFLETSLLNPKILGNMLHLDPVLVLTILAVSEHFFGVWGLLLGVPVMVYVIRVVILDEDIPGFLEPLRESSS